MADLPNERSGLEAREALTDESEIDLSFHEAQLRGRERLIGAQREALTQRAAWLDERERRLVRANDGAPSRTHPLSGLGDGRALQDADVEGYVARSATLHLGRVALLAAREEMLARRKALLRSRREELEAYEEAFTRAEVRLAARERLVAQSTVQLQRSIAAEANKSAEMFSAEARQTLMATGAMPAALAPQREPPVPATPQTKSAKRITSMPIIRPVALPSAADSTAPALHPAPALAADGGFSAATAKAHSEPVLAQPVSPSGPVVGPRTRVLVDSDPANVERHADTMAMDQDEHTKADAALREARPTPEASNYEPGVPSDLPSAPPDLPRVQRGQTISMLGTLWLDELAICREQIEFDSKGRTILVSFGGAMPNLPKRTELVWRERDGSRQHFAVQVRRVMSTAPRGHAVVLAPTDWVPTDFDTLAGILLRLP